jgi:hypothetical protein
MPPRSTHELEPLDHLGDFTATARMIPIAGLAVAIGIGAALVATALLKLIGLFTNLFFSSAWPPTWCRRRGIISDRSSSWCRSSAR